MVRHSDELLNEPVGDGEKPKQTKNKTKKRFKEKWFYWRENKKDLLEAKEKQTTKQKK